MRIQYPILGLQKNGFLIMWDGPCLSREKAKRLIKKRRKQYPDIEFFIYKDEFIGEWVGVK